MWKLLGCLATSFLLACGPGPSPDGEDPADSEAEALSSAPMFIHYSFLPGPDGKADAARTAKLIVPKALNVMVAADPSPEGAAAMATWHAAGGHTAKRVALEDILDELARPGGRDLIAEALAEGFQLVGVDELQDLLEKDGVKRAGKAARVRDGAALTPKLVALLARHAGKVILYVNTYNMAGAPAAENELRHFRTVLRACATHCLAVASEMYLATPEVFAKGGPSKAGCGNGLACHAYAANLLENEAPGIRKKLVDVIEVRGAHNGILAKSGNDPRTGDAIHREMIEISRLGLRGVGTYALHYVANDAKDFDAASAKMITSFRLGARAF